jgi:hypothetical protein
MGVFFVSEKVLSHEEQWYMVRCSRLSKSALSH